MRQIQQVLFLKFGDFAELGQVFFAEVKFYFFWHVGRYLLFSRYSVDTNAQP